MLWECHWCCNVARDIVVLQKCDGVVEASPMLQGPSPCCGAVSRRCEEHGRCRESTLRGMPPCPGASLVL